MQFLTLSINLVFQVAIGAAPVDPNIAALRRRLGITVGYTVVKPPLCVRKTNYFCQGNYSASWVHVLWGTPYARVDILLGNLTL